MRTCCTQWQRCGDANKCRRGMDDQPENQTNRGNQKWRQKQTDRMTGRRKQTASQTVTDSQTVEAYKDYLSGEFVIFIRCYRILLALLVLLITLGVTKVLTKQQPTPPHLRLTNNTFHFHEFGELDTRFLPDTFYLCSPKTALHWWLSCCRGIISSQMSLQTTAFWRSDSSNIIYTPHISS